MEISESTSTVAATGVVASDATQDFETFLRMLTTQIQNQDPLSPLDADDFANQLATFSLVEQQTLTNQNIEKLVTEQRSKTFLEHVSLLGRSVSHSGNFQFNGNSIEFDLNPANVGPDEVLAIFNRDGALVAELDTSLASDSLEWAGVNTQGQTVLPGEYTARLKNIRDGSVSEDPVLVRSVVQEVFYQDESVVLKLTDGTEISQRQISKIGV